MANERIPKRVEHFLLEHLDGEMLLYHPGLAKTIQLNETASMIWGLCNGQRSIGEIAELLSGAFAEDGRQVEEDVSRTVQRFADEGAVEFRHE